MSWEYKCETIKCPASEIEDKMNEIGKEGWEIFCLYEKDYICESCIRFECECDINWYELAMKRKSKICSDDVITSTLSFLTTDEI